MTDDEGLVREMVRAHCYAACDGATGGCKSPSECHVGKPYDWNGMRSALAVVRELEGAASEAAARTEGVRQGREEAARTAETVSQWGRVGRSIARAIRALPDPREPIA